MFRIPEQPGLEPLKFTSEIDSVIRRQGIGINGGVDLKSMENKLERGSRIGTGARRGERETRRGSRKTQHNKHDLSVSRGFRSGKFFSVILTGSKHGFEIFPALVPQFHTLIELANADVDGGNHEFGTTVNAPLVDNEVIFQPLERSSNGIVTETESLLNRAFGSLHATLIRLTASEIHEDFEHRRIGSFSNQFKTFLLIHHTPTTF